MHLDNLRTTFVDFLSFPLYICEIDIVELVQMRKKVVLFILWEDVGDNRFDLSKFFSECGAL